MDKQAVESQEMNSRFTEQITSLKSEHDVILKENKEKYEEKVALLETTCKRQEQELIRINQQDRVSAL